MKTVIGLSINAIALFALIMPHNIKNPISTEQIQKTISNLMGEKEINDALSNLVSAGYVGMMTHTINGITLNVYWPLSVTINKIKPQAKINKSIEKTYFQIPETGPVRPAEAAAYLRINRCTLYAWVKLGKLKIYKGGPRTSYLRAEELRLLAGDAPNA